MFLVSFQDVCGVDLVSCAVVEHNGHLCGCDCDGREGTGIPPLILGPIVEQQTIFGNVVLNNTIKTCECQLIEVCVRTQCQGLLQ